jgi:hypothetical protein
MTKKIIEYKMHKIGVGNMMTPDFIEDGGYFRNPSDNSLIGLVDNDREYWIPDTNKDVPAGTLTEYTTAELVARMQGIGMNKEDGTPMTDGEISTYVTNWCNAKGVEA